MTPSKPGGADVFCESCCRWLLHDRLWCPLFPAVKAPPVFSFTSSGKRAKGRKWSRCVCLEHTCYDAKELGLDCSPEDAPLVRGW